MKDMLLREYRPKSEAVTSAHHYDKPRFEVIDIHTHMGKLLLGPDYDVQYGTSQFIERLKSVGVTRLCNMDGFWGDEFDRMLRKTAGYEDRIFNFIWIDCSCIDEPDFSSSVRRHIEESVRKGARGIKMWKDISLETKDKSGRYLRTDDERFNTVYDTAAELGIPILIHIADPVAFFRPVDKYNERYEQLIAHPEWSFCQPYRYSFNELMEMQDNMIERHPHTTFIVAHFGSYSENLAHVGQRLDRYQNMYVDIAARIDELGRVPYSARDFFIRYKDRILFGSDCTPLSYGEHQTAYRFLESRDEYFPYWPEDEEPDGGRWRIYGLGLPDDVLEYVYNKNAKRLLRIE